jgi:hypothetical protein
MFFLLSTDSRKSFSAPFCAPVHSPIQSVEKRSPKKIQMEIFALVNADLLVLRKKDAASGGLLGTG